MALICKNIDQISSRLIGPKLWSPSCGQQIRTKKKLTLRSPQLPVYEKKLLLAACEPIKKRSSALPTSMTCYNVAKLQNVEPHPYIRILADDLKDNLEKSPFIVLFHLNPVQDLYYRDAKNALIRAGFNPQIYQNNVAELALRSTKYEPLLKFYSRSIKTIIAFSDQLNVQPLLKIEKSSPFLILMFGIHQDRVLRKDELVEIANLPSLSSLHAQLYHTLNSFGASLTSTLDYHGSQLVRSLATHSGTDKV